MAFQALYRKWRSQTFDELVGQEHVVKTLRNAIVAGRIGHAYLFTGPRGVGKTTSARLLAKAVNCLAEPEQRPCDQCESCKAITEGRAVDVIEMDAASNRGVDDARELMERVQFRPTSARVKVYVIDECFRYEDLVTLADGTKEPIGKIVENEMFVDVLSYNEATGLIEPKPILRHMRKQPHLPMVKITFDNNRRIVCTINHKFYTPHGKLHAGELDVGQLVYANYERTTKHQLEVVAGAALGDGHLSLTGSRMRGRLSITHGVDQKDYLDYKVQLLGDLVESAPRYQLAPESYSKKGVYQVATLSRPQIAELHRDLYNEEGRKKISTDYLHRIGPLGLALWYLDDGSLVTAKHQYTKKDQTVSVYPATRSTFSVYGFTVAEVQTIVEWLDMQWGIEARFSNTAKGPAIWLTLAGTAKLHSIIAPYVPPSMEYKLLPEHRGQFQEPADDMVPSGLAVSVVKKIESVPAEESKLRIITTTLCAISWWQTAIC
jgi:hypothetical protein